MVENHRSCLWEMAYWKQLRAKARMLFSVLCIPCHTAGPLTVWTVRVFSAPLSPLKVRVAVPGSSVTMSTALYMSP